MSTTPRDFPAALALLLALATGARAAPELLLGSGLGAPGGSVVLPLGHVADGSTVALQVDLVHDPAVLSVADVAPGAALSGGDHELSWHLVAPGRLRLIVLSATNAPLPGGALAAVSYRLAADAPLGDQAIGLEDVERVTSLAAVVSPGAAFGGTVTVLACLAGDLFPTGAGDGSLGLADLLQALRDLRAGTASGGRYAACADLAVGGIACGRAAPEAWCPSGDGDAFSLADALVLRRLASGVARLACASCDALPEPPAAPVPADLSAPFGDVTVADVLRLLRAAVGLDLLTPEELLVADVSPAGAAVDGLRPVEGDGDINVQDVLVALRVAVALEQIAWPARSLVLSLPASASFAAFSATLIGLPSEAGAPTLEGADCSDAAASGVDAAIGTWAVTCVSDPELRANVTGAVASLLYRSPHAIDPATLRLSSELVDAALASTTGALAVTAGAP